MSICGGLATLAVGQVTPATGPGLTLSLSGTRPAESRPATTRPQVKSDLNGICSLQLRGTRLREAFAELADRLGVRYILDASIPAAAMEEPVRISATHLTGQQAFRWVARTAGVSAVLVDGIFLVAPEDRLPAVWRATGTGTPSERASEDARWARVNGRRIDVNWVDAPLTGVAEDVANLFGVDVLYHPALLAAPKLVYMRESGVNLERIREVLGRQLNARTELYDGALWICPQGEVVQWLPASGRPADAAASRPEEFHAPPLDMWVGVDRSVTTWAAFAAAVSAASGVPCAVDGEEGAVYPGIETAGSVAEVLDGLRMLGMVAWNIGPEGPANGPRINIKVREKR
jgi:hypothetical protein